MKKTSIRLMKSVGDADYSTLQPWRFVDRWVCNRGHPHPTQAGAEDCESARADGASDAELQAMFDAEVAEFNS